MSQESEIIIQGDLNSNLIRVITQVCVNLQKQFDIAPSLINEIINNPGFVEEMQNINKTSSQAIEKQFLELKENTQEKQNSWDDSDNFNSSNNWEREKCGYLIQEYPNGYKKYCNQHKYMHAETITKHEFIFKNPGQILEEKEFTQRMNHYQQYLNNLLNQIQDLLLQHIKQKYTIIRIDVGQVIALLDWLKGRNDCFKTKLVENLVDQDKNGLQFNYGNFIDLYLPTSEMTTYLKEIEEFKVSYKII